MTASAVMKASVLLVAIVGLMWIGMSNDAPAPATATMSYETLRAPAGGSALAHSREVYEERRARWTEREASSTKDVAQR